MSRRFLCHIQQNFHFIISRGLFPSGRSTLLLCHQGTESVLLHILRQIHQCRRNIFTTPQMKSSGSSLTGISVNVTPAPGRLLVDDKLHITVTGLKYGQKITVYAYVEDTGKKFESWCWFVANQHGVVDLYSQESLAGTYTGVSPMGIFWSMLPLPGQQRGIWLMKNDVDTPLSTRLSVYDGHFTADDIRTSKLEPLHDHTIDRWFKDEGVTSVEVEFGRIRGQLFLPPEPGPFQGVIDLFGTVGGITKFRSALLASRGFASLALPYFMYKDLPKTLDSIDLDYFIEAVDWLLSHEKVWSGGVGTIGVSKGGDICLLMGAHCPKVSAIVNINGCTFNSIFPIKFKGGVIPEVTFRRDLIEMTGTDSCRTKNTLPYEVKDLIPVWRNNANVLNILSEDDQFYPQDCMYALKNRYPPDKGDNCVILSYPGAGHAIEPPYSPHYGRIYNPLLRMLFEFGGSPAPHAAAQEDSWPRILQHFRDNIPRSPRSHL